MKSAFNKRHVHYEGVYYDSKAGSEKPWKAVFQSGRKYRYLGHYRTPEQANNVVLQYKKVSGLSGEDDNV